jgi:hypothetical protein
MCHLWIVWIVARRITDSNLQALGGFAAQHNDIQSRQDGVFQTDEPDCPPTGRQCEITHRWLFDSLRLSMKILSGRSMAEQAISLHDQAAGELMYS